MDSSARRDSSLNSQMNMFLRTRSDSGKKLNDEVSTVSGFECIIIIRSIDLRTFHHLKNSNEKVTGKML